MNDSIGKFKARFDWTEVQAPRPWRPKPGEELCGYYGGRTLRDGIHGQYEIVIVHVPHVGAVTVSGTALINLLDAAAIAEGHPVRIVFEGEVEWGKTTDKKTKKQFRLLIAEGQPIAADELPRVEGYNS